MTIKLYKNLSESNVVDKTLVPISTLEGALRDPSSVTDPTFSLHISADDVSGVNYIKVEEWNRFYFVENIVSINTDLWMFKCHVDVLSTYKSAIRELSAIIARQESFYNLYLDDDKFLVNAQRMYWTKAFPNRVTAGNSSGACSFILTIAGGAETSATTTE